MIPVRSDHNAGMKPTPWAAEARADRDRTRQTFIDRHVMKLCREFVKCDSSTEDTRR